MTAQDREAKTIYVIWYSHVPFGHELGAQWDAKVCFNKTEYEKQLEAIKYLYNNATVRVYRLNNENP